MTFQNSKVFLQVVPKADTFQDQRNQEMKKNYKKQSAVNSSSYTNLLQN